MSEDTSHEFVKAEDDIPQTLPAISMEKDDDDDFVDEPLSSPRIAVTADKVNEQQFEDPELVVAPLSPTKAKPTEAASSTDGPDATSQKTEETATIPQIGTLKPEPQVGDTGVSPMTPTFSLDLPPSTAGAAETSAVAQAKEPELAPRPEDTPAPLFAGNSTVESQPSDSASRAPGQIAEAEASAETLVDESAAAPAGTQAEQAVLSSQQPEGSGDVEPVVGDYLKMQFVEHRVVPTILVSC